jgi:glucose/arabinose dehydrogenase
MVRAYAFLVTTTALLGTAVISQRSSQLPQPYATQSVRNHPHVISQPAGAQLKVPDGFSVEVWASGFATPRFMLEGSQGEVLIADCGATAEAAAVGSAGSHARRTAPTSGAALSLCSNCAMAVSSYRTMAARKSGTSPMGRRDRPPRNRTVCPRPQARAG